MKKKVNSAPDKTSEAWKLMQEITVFVNTVFGRKFGDSRSLYDAVNDALEAGYEPDDLRIAFWTARCIQDYWISDALKDDLAPDIVLRFKAGTNPKTGIPVKRWLDECISRVAETSPAIVGRVLKSLPSNMQESQKALLKKYSVAYDER